MAIPKRTVEYLFNKGDGQFVIDDLSSVNIIKFGTGVKSTDISLSANGDDLVITIKNTNDKITMVDLLSQNLMGIETLKFYDGEVMTIDTIINKMGGGYVAPISTKNIINGNDLKNVLNGKTIDDEISGYGGNDILNGNSGNDTLNGGSGNDFINGGVGADSMMGGIGNDTYVVDNIGDIVVEAGSINPDTNWISSDYLKDVYSRTFPRVVGNQWHVTPDGMLSIAAKYTTDDTGKTVLDMDASWQENQKYVDMIANYFDFVTLNRAGVRTGTDDYNDLFLDNYDSTHNPNMGLLKTRNDIYATDDNQKTYVIPYLNLTDVWKYESITQNPDWNFWHKPDGQNIGTWDYIMNHDLTLKTSSGEIIHYSSTNDSRPMFDPTQELWRQYYADHVKGIVDQGFDGVFSDNWWRSRYVGDIHNLTESEFQKVQEGWEKVGQAVQQVLGDKIFVGNSPAYGRYPSRDVVMLEDRIDDVQGTADNSIAAYFRYSDLARKANQVCIDSYYWSDRAPFESFRLPMNLLTDNLLGLGAATSGGTVVSTVMEPIMIIGEIGYPLGDKEIVSGTATGRKDIVEGYAVERAVYMRKYTNGIVYLNDTGTTQTLTLPEGQWVRSDGVAFRGGTPFTLNNSRGWVFKRLDAPAIDMNDRGVDTVQSSITYALGDNLENLTLIGKGDINGTGNSLDNVIVGNSGKNVLNGMGGNDTYIVNKGFGQDVIQDNNGTDSILFGKGIKQSSLEFAKVGDNLNIVIKNTKDKLTVENWFAGSQNKIEYIRFDDKTFLTTSDIEINPVPGTDGKLIPSITGSDKSDKIAGLTSNNTYNVRKGNDIIIDAKGDDIYLFNKGDGRDTIADAAGFDTIKFGEGITKDDLTFSRTATSLIIRTKDGADGITVANWFKGSKYAVESLSFVDGTSMDATEIAKSVVITGSDLANKIKGYTTNDTYNARKGNDIITDAKGNDTYLFNKGDGRDTIADAAGFDIIKFGQDITEQDIAIYKDKKSLVIVYGDNDIITITNQKNGELNIEALQLSNGKFINDQDINRIIQDITAYDSAHAELAVTSVNDVKSNPDLMNAISVSWHN